MDNKHRTYCVTDAGSRALTNPSPTLSVPFRRILGLLEGETHFAVIRRGMAMCLETQVVGWLQQLESQGLLKSNAVGAERDLDFTGSLSLADLAAAAKAR